MIRKALIALAAAIVTISGVALAAPASASLATHRDGGTKPKPYPASVVTQIRIDMEPSTIRVGRCAWANITVRSAVFRRPTGSVQVQVDGRTFYVGLINGRASLCIPGLGVGSYTVVANYRPTPGSIWKPSSDADFLRVVRRGQNNCHHDMRYSRR